jgi:hypothetical protein
MPALVLDSITTGDAWTSQGAYVSIGESGALGSASMHMTYRGDGYGFIGAGTVTNGEPVSFFRFDYNSDNIYSDDTLTVANLECTDCVDAGDIGASAVGSSEVISSQVQLRVSGTCPAGEAIQSISDTGTVTCVAVGAASCAQQVFEVSLADYGNSGSDCSDGTNRYNGCGNYDHPSFTWTDAAGCAPSAVTVEYNQGVSCSSGIFNVLLNGAAVATWNQIDSCTCTPTITPGVTSITSLSGYDANGANTVTFEGYSCNGFSQIVGTSIYAIVTVDY